MASLESRWNSRSPPAGKVKLCITLCRTARRSTYSVGRRAYLWIFIERNRVLLTEEHRSEVSVSSCVCPAVRSRRPWGVWQVRCSSDNTDATQHAVRREVLEEVRLIAMDAGLVMIAQAERPWRGTSTTTWFASPSRRRTVRSRRSASRSPRCGSRPPRSWTPCEPAGYRSGVASEYCSGSSCRASFAHPFLV